MMIVINIFPFLYTKNSVSWWNSTKAYFKSIISRLWKKNAMPETKLPDSISTNARIKVPGCWGEREYFPKSWSDLSPPPQSLAVALSDILWATKRLYPAVHTSQGSHFYNVIRENSTIRRREEGRMLERYTLASSVPSQERPEISKNDESTVYILVFKYGIT